MTWQGRAIALAETAVYPQSRWRDAVVSTPRYLLVPRWFEKNQQTRGWEVRDGWSDQDRWLDAAYGAWRPW